MSGAPDEEALDRLADQLFGSASPTGGAEEERVRREVEQLGQLLDRDARAKGLGTAGELLDADDPADEAMRAGLQRGLEEPPVPAQAPRRWWLGVAAAAAAALLVALGFQMSRPDPQEDPPTRTILGNGPAKITALEPSGTIAGEVPVFRASGTFQPSWTYRIRIYDRAANAALPLHVFPLEEPTWDWTREPGLVLPDAFDWELQVLRDGEVIDSERVSVARSSG